MELPSEILKQIAFNTRAKIEELILIVMTKSTHEEHLSQPLQSNNKQNKIAVTILTAYNGIFNITNKSIKFYFEKTITNEDDFIRISISQGAYEIESLNKEIKRIFVNEGHFTEADYPFTIKPNCSTLGSNIEINLQGAIISFASDDSIRSLLGFQQTISPKEYSLSKNPVENISFDNIFLEYDIAKGLIYNQQRIGIIHIFTMDVNPGYNFIEKFRGGIQWYMMGSKDNISSICFNLKNEHGKLLSFSGQSVTFRLSIKEI